MLREHYYEKYLAAGEWQWQAYNLRASALVPYGVGLAHGWVPAQMQVEAVVVEGKSVKALATRPT